MSIEKEYIRLCYDRFDGALQNIYLKRMKKIPLTQFVLLVIIFIIGGLSGVSKWISTYGSYYDPIEFKKLQGAQLRKVVYYMVETQQFSNVLKFARKMYPNEEPRAHGFGHILGEAAYRVYNAKAFAKCDSIFNYGCYHGVIEMAIKLNGPRKSLASELWDACKKGMKNPAPCGHALGHVNIIVSDYQILPAFEMCDSLFADEGKPNDCWDGVMMESITQTFHSDSLLPYGRPADPYYPCNTFPIKYEAECVAGHVLYLRNIWGHDFKKLLDYCTGFKNTDTITRCVDHIGMVSGQDNFPSALGSVKDCHWAGDYETVCILGAVAPYAESRNIEEANKLCNTLTSSDDQLHCRNRIRDIVGML